MAFFVVVSFLLPFALLLSWRGFFISRERGGDTIGRTVNNDGKRLLQELKDTAYAIGCTPVKSEFPKWRELKRHFGSWEKAVRAAGLASANSPEQHSLRAKKRRKSYDSASNLKGGGAN